MIGPTMLKPVQYLNNGTIRCLCCNQIFTEEEIERHVEEFCFPSDRLKSRVAYRVELLNEEPCWQCSKSLVNIHGKCSAPYVAYVATVKGCERKLHRRCAEGLGFKCVTSLGQKGQDTNRGGYLK